MLPGLSTTETSLGPVESRVVDAAVVGALIVRRKYYEHYSAKSKLGNSHCFFIQPAGLEEIVW